MRYSIALFLATALSLSAQSSTCQEKGLVLAGSFNTRSDDSCRAALEVRVMANDAGGFVFATNDPELANIKTFHRKFPIMNAFASVDAQGAAEALEAIPEIEARIKKENASNISRTMFEATASSMNGGLWASFRITASTPSAGSAKFTITMSRDDRLAVQLGYWKVAKDEYVGVITSETAKWLAGILRKLPTSAAVAAEKTRAQKAVEDRVFGKVPAESRPTDSRSVR